MPAIWGAAIGGAVSLFNGHKAGKQAKSQEKAAAKAQAAQLEVQKEQLAFGKSQWDDYRSKFDPAYEDARDLAYEERRPDMAVIAADVGSAMDAGQGAERRQMARYGLNPSDGAWGQSEREYGMTRGAAIAGAANMQRRGERDARFQRIASLTGMLNPIANMAANSIGSGYAGMSSAYGGAADTAAYNAANHRANESASYAELGNSIGRGVSAWGANKAPDFGDAGKVGAGTMSMNAHPVSPVPTTYGSQRTPDYSVA